MRKEHGIRADVLDLQARGGGFGGDMVKGGEGDVCGRSYTGVLVGIEGMYIGRQ